MLFKLIQDYMTNVINGVLINNIRQMQCDALKVREEVKPQAPQRPDSAKSPHRSSTVSHGQSEGAESKANDSTIPAQVVSKGLKLDGTQLRPNFGRDMSMFQVDKQPKDTLVMGSRDVPEGVAMELFQNTERVGKVEDGWLM